MQQQVFHDRAGALGGAVGEPAESAARFGFTAPQKSGDAQEELAIRRQRNLRPVAGRRRGFRRERFEEITDEPDESGDETAAGAHIPSISLPAPHGQTASAMPQLKSATQ